MSETLRKALMAAAATLIIAPIIALLLVPAIEFSVLIMVEIAVVAFFTVIVVMIVGSEEDHYPTEAKDSAAVNKWSQREAAKQSQRAQESVENMEETSAQA